MRSLVIAAVAALAFASLSGASFGTSASMNVPAGPFKLDANGMCHAANGQFVGHSQCVTPPHCKHGVPCGHACIAKNKVCHVATPDERQYIPGKGPR
ncbi:MAG: hypothetical protein ACHP7N_01470 [Caulobacterales bacterium]